MKTINVIRKLFKIDGIDKEKCLETALESNSELECNNINSFTVVLNENDNFTFGKYSGLKISDVIKVDPEYIIWCDINLNYIKFKPIVIKIAESNVINKIRCKIITQKKKREMCDDKCDITNTIFDDDNDAFH